MLQEKRMTSERSSEPQGTARCRWVGKEDPVMDTGRGPEVGNQDAAASRECVSTRRSQQRENAAEPK